MGYRFGLTGAVGTTAAIPVAAACVASMAAEGAMALFNSPANDVMRDGSLTTVDTASPALTLRIWLAASTLWF
jgi:hypothetical protein